ncbi:MAG: Helix-turn-helix, AraC domain protein [Actinomycetia bacterium]|nr:Helix-turn-helix, AraC domain protein [Actinomycetes bacterium]
MRFERFPPSPPVARFVEGYWLVTWDRAGRAPDERQVPPQPVASIVLGDGPARLEGPSSATCTRTLAGAGRMLGVTFRPAGFRPFAAGPLSELAERVVPYDELPVDVDAVDAHLAALVPDEPRPSEATTLVVERIAADPSVVRVATLADHLELSERQLQRRFLDHVGVRPKQVIRRYRLAEAAERARTSDVDWAALAAELGYSDQSHLVRDFTAVLGRSPERWLATSECRTCRA